MITKVFNKLTFDAIEGENVFDVYNRADIVFSACQFGNAKCRKMSREYFQKFMERPNE